jgi:hypothetical protein
MKGRSESKRQGHLDGVDIAGDKEAESVQGTSLTYVGAGAGAAGGALKLKEMKLDLDYSIEVDQRKKKKKRSNLDRDLTHRLDLS